MPSWKKRWNLPFLRDIRVCGSQVISRLPRIKLAMYFRGESVIPMLKKRIQPSKLRLVVIHGRSDKERPMSRWYVPLTMLGLGSVGAFLLSERERKSLSATSENCDDREWNASAQSELDRIQAALSRIAESLEPQT
jgi:hypothetical protein